MIVRPHCFFLSDQREECWDNPSQTGRGDIQSSVHWGEVPHDFVSKPLASPIAPACSSSHFAISREALSDALKAVFRCVFLLILPSCFRVLNTNYHFTILETECLGVVGDHHV